MTSTVCDTLISPRADFNIRSKYSKCKTYESPNFRDILRKRCRERMKARRGAMFDHLRSLDSEENVRNALSQIISCDLEELQSSCASTHSTNSELMDVDDGQPLTALAVTEREKWILEEYEKFIEEMTNYQVELAEQVLCPVCQGGSLGARGDLVACSRCSLRLPRTESLGRLETLISSAAARHERCCPAQPSFTTLPDPSLNLFLLCSTCSLFDQVV